MEDLVFKYIENICSRKDLITEHENIFKNIIENITTGKDLKYDFVSMFTYAIFWQQSTLRIAGLIEKDFLPRMKKEKINFQDFPKKILHWVETDLGFKSKTTKKVLIGVGEFISFIESLNDSQLTDPKEFESVLAKYHNKPITSIKDGLIGFSQMGEKTAGLFLKTVGYYSNLRGLKEWREYRYPTFGILEVYIQRFIKDIYEYYGGVAYERGLFEKFILNAPVSLDIVRMAYVEGETFDKFLKDS